MFRLATGDCSATPALAEVTVLDLSSVGPASRASAMLADYGARVVKVAPVPGDAGRRIVPPAYAYSGHRGTERVQIDLKSNGGRTAFLRLVASADVVIESFRPGVMSRLGIGYEQLRAANDDVILCSTTGYGQRGAHAARAGHDLNYQAVAGVLHCGERALEDKPALPGATYADSAGGGMHAVIAVLAALMRRGATGEGAHLDVSVTRGVLSLMSLAVDEYLATGTVPGPRHGILTGRYACYENYRCTDGWVSVAAIEPVFFANLCRLLGCERWISHQLDDTVQDDVRADFATAFASGSREDWLAVLADADTCVAAVWSVPELVDELLATDPDLVVEATHPAAGSMRQLAPMLAGMSPACAELPDTAHTDSDDVFTKAGMSPAEVADLRDRGVIA